MSDSITIRNLTETDFSNLWEYVSDSNCTKYLTWNYYEKKSDFKKKYKQFLKLTKAPNEFLGICLNNKVIGSIHLILRSKTKVQFGFGISKQYWNKGICTNAVSLAINHLISSWQFKGTVLADVHKENIPAKKILKKNKFSLQKENIEPLRDRFILSI